MVSWLGVFRRQAKHYFRSRCCHSMKGEIVWEIDAADIFIEQSELDPKWVKAVSFASMVTVTGSY